MTFIKRLILGVRYYSTAASQNINGQNFIADSYSNLSPRIISALNRKLFSQQEHPLCLIKERVIRFFYNRFKNKRGNPLFSVFDDLNPVVTTYQNFDSLLIPKDHPSRSKSDCYYINREFMLRAHMTAHQYELIKMGLNNFLMVGDVFRRDDINKTHYPIFHQLDGVRLLAAEELFVEVDDGVSDMIIRSGDGQRTKHKQEVYTERASTVVEVELKSTFEDLMKELFGKEIQFRWNNEIFPFTHPSWELEILLGENWVEVLGCGITEYKILENAGCTDRIGWAFGLGLERLAMAYYSVPDIRLFWSTDSGFLNQFKGKTCSDKVTFKPVSVHPACSFDLSFWITDLFDEQDFYEIVREICNDLIEQIERIDVFKHPKTGRESRCYRLVYRSMERILTKEELNVLHDKVSKETVAKFNVEIR